MATLASHTKPERPLVAVDWGTSSLRAALLLNGQLQEERSSELGIMNIEPGEFAQVLNEFCANWLNLENVLILISGMAGSAQGWQLAPYCACPVSIAHLANSVHWISPGKIGIIPGLSVERSGVPDVMRGEEIQVFGALALTGKESARMVLPGTHSKWVQVHNKRIVDFSTYMTGEFFSVLKTHSILSKTLQDVGGEPTWDALAFERGLAGGEHKHLLHDVFAVRTLALFERESAGALLNQLSGLLIGYELRGQDLSLDEEIIIIGAPALERRYAHALRFAGASPVALGSAATWRGFGALAKLLP